MLFTRLLVLVASLISSLACLTPLVSSSMILSVLLLKCDFCALSSKLLTKFAYAVASLKRSFNVIL
ncbi:hypothetical protein [Helicobacter pylori]|uniref:hypothetical protein n=1 Tax=Helicobacter pylori TaxID=210 RepID=UPI002159DC9D|nr:hypothetical protein [Helicobacter pylori]